MQRIDTSCFSIIDSIAINIKNKLDIHIDRAYNNRYSITIVRIV